MDRILITGGAGYIGSELTKKLLARGHEIVVLDAFLFSDAGIRSFRQHPSLRVIAGDIRDRANLDDSLQGVDAVVHLAAVANDPSAALNPGLTRSINLDSYAYLLEAAARAGAQRFINSSSISVYGNNHEADLTEADVINPLTEYGACKAESEKLVSASNRPGFTTVNIRWGTVCGWSPRMRFDLCLNTLTAHAVATRRLTVWGGDQRRPQVHIDDVTECVWHLLEAPADRIGGQVFNFAGQNLTVMQIGETIKKLLGGEVELITAARRDDERSYRVSSERIARELGLAPRRNISDAAGQIIAAFKAGLWSNLNDPLYHNVEQMKLTENCLNAN